MDRLRRRRDLEKVFQQGRRCYGPGMVLQARRRGEGEPEQGVRVGTVAGRGFRTAVARTRARRLLRETCRVTLGKSEGAWDVVLIARPEMLGLPYAERARVMAALLREAGVLEEKTASPSAGA